MQIRVKYLDNLKVQANFDDFEVTSDQPVRYKGDGTAPGPFDYFLASSVLCAGYFVNVYCKARGISTTDIKITQDNIVDPENRYKQTFKIMVEMPEEISGKDKKGILASIDRCTVKKTIQEGVNFVIESKEILGKEKNNIFDDFVGKESKTLLLGKDSPVEETLTKLTALLKDLGIKIEISSWRNPVPNVWSVHIRDADSPMNYTNGKGATKESALCSALGEFLERISNNYFYNDFYLGEEASEREFVHYPNEKWFPITNSETLPIGLLDGNLLDIYDQEGRLLPHHLIDTNSANTERGIVALPFTRYSDQQIVYIPVNIVGNLYVSNGMSAGNTAHEARVQCLSEIFERAIKNKIIEEEISLPDVPQEIIEKYPLIHEGIKSLERRGFPILVKDASLGGKFPVMNVTLMNPKTGGVFSSFGAHPKFEVALERSLTELLQGRSFEGLNDMPAPTFNSEAVTGPNNIIDHFIDSTGTVSWRFFSNQSDYVFSHWNFNGDTTEEFKYLMNILQQMGLEAYIADYEDLGFPACRIIVPGFSEIYPPEDLIWDNNNLAIKFRQRIMQINSLQTKTLERLVTDLEESEQDNYKPISELIGIAFDENSTWGECTIGEIKCFIYLALDNLEQAKLYAEEYSLFNDSSQERKKLFQLINILLDIELHHDLSFNNYVDSLIKMYGENFVKRAKKIIEGEIRFPDLEDIEPTFSNQLKHNALLESYKKLVKTRSSFTPLKS